MLAARRMMLNRVGAVPFSGPTIPFNGFNWHQATSGGVVSQPTSGAITTTANALWLVTIAWGSSVATDGATSLSCTDDQSNTYAKVAEVVQENHVGAAMTLGLTVFSTTLPASPVDPVLTFSGLPGSVFAAIEVNEFLGAQVTSNVGTNKQPGNSDITSLTVTLPSSPGAADAVLAIVTTWGHPTISEDANYTYLNNIVPANGPYFSGINMDVSYDTSSPGSSVTQTFSPACDTAVGAAVMVSPL